MGYHHFFRRAAGSDPFPYQARLAEGPEWPAVVEIPTGLGKTAAVVLGWLYRRTSDAHWAGTPRRLVYCLPMRVLVEQTAEAARGWIQKLGLADRVAVATLMGGALEDDWDVRAESEAILIGTQDILLSRALNRGYGLSRYRWPLHFGLLNNDCQWVIDEVQLVGAGVATSAQLQAFRRRLGTILPTRTTWMSATVDRRWLESIDVEAADIEGHIELTVEDLDDATVRQRRQARKPCGRAGSPYDDAKRLSAEILAAHRPGTRSLVVVNRVDRALGVFDALRTARPRARLALLHSRFRAADRADQLDALLADPPTEGTIAVSTQVVEAGVDVSVATLFTDVAPWAALVQRFGRCNRRGEIPDARVFWIPQPSSENARKKLDGRPYDDGALAEAEGVLETLQDAASASRPTVPFRLAGGQAQRRKDLLDLFDTTSDLMGQDVDVSRFIREGDEHDVRLYWRDFEDEPDEDAWPPAREELCAAPVQAARKMSENHDMWLWDALAGRFDRVSRERPIYPGITVLLRAADGGYLRDQGFSPSARARVEPVTMPRPARETETSYGDDPLSEARTWLSLAQHAQDVHDEAQAIASALGLRGSERGALAEAARWHDAGKAHATWQDAAKKGVADSPPKIVAKSARKGRLRYARRGFRHELASALLALAHGRSDLVAFLIASHHGKVRVSIRALPDERGPGDPDSRFARGVWEGDELPQVDLGGGIVVPPTTLTLEYMELGESERTGPSWLARVLRLRDDPMLGPFRLAFLEALLKCADERASARVARPWMNGGGAP